jgi:tryptophan synthase beta chain
VAPETSHALAQVIREAPKAKKEGKEKVILFSLSGYGLLDMQRYADYFPGKLSNLELSEAEIEKALAGLPKLETVG